MATLAEVHLTYAYRARDAGLEAHTSGVPFQEQRLKRRMASDSAGVTLYRRCRASDVCCGAANTWNVVARSVRYAQQMAAPAIEEFLGGPSWLCMATLVILSVMVSGCVVSPESSAESNGASYELTMQGFVDQAWAIALVQVDNHEDDTWSFRVVKTLKGVMPVACEQWRFDGQGNEDRGRNVLVYGPMRYRAGEDVVPVWLWYTGLNERGYWLRLYPAPDGFWEADVDTRWEELWRWDTPGLIQALQRAREGQRGHECSVENPS